MRSDQMMIVVEQIAQTASRTTKTNYLQRYPDLKPILLWTYNPRIQFYVKPTEGWANSCGLEFFDDDTFKLLDALSKRLITGSEAKRHVINELNRLEPLSQTLLLRILNRDLRWGLAAKTINKVFPGLIPVFPVQLAKLYTDGAMRFPCIGSYKVDGLRCIYENGKLYSRYGRPFVGLDDIAALFHDLHVKRIDGEITVKGKAFDDLSGEIRSFKKTDNAVFNVFDVHPIGDPMPLYDRMNLVNFLVDEVFDSSVVAVPFRTLNDEHQMFDMYNDARAEGYEGLVVKKEDGLPFNGRNNDWLKLKPRDTADILVTGIEEGVGKYEGAVGALVCDYRGVEVRVGSGLTDLQRITWMKDPNRIVGKTIEVEYMERSKEGRLRHPRLKHIRGDK